MWHVSSRSSVATVRIAIHLLVSYLLTYLLTVQTLPDGLETQFTAPDTDSTVLSCLAGGANLALAVDLGNLRLRLPTRWL